MFANEVGGVAYTPNKKSHRIPSVAFIYSQADKSTSAYIILNIH